MTRPNFLEVAANVEKNDRSKLESTPKDTYAPIENDHITDGGDLYE